MSLLSILKTRIEPPATAIISLPVFMIGGSIFAVFGAFAGFVVGMMLPLPFDFGGLPGYEGAGVFWGMVGIALASWLFLSLWVREKTLRMTLLRLYAQFWLVALAFQHYQALVSVDSGPWLSAIVPITLTGVAAFFLQRNAKRRNVMLLVSGIAATGLVAACALIFTFIPSFGRPDPFTDPGIVVDVQEVSDVRLVVIASRDDSRATVGIYRDDSAAGPLLRALHLEKRYGTVYVLKNRRDYTYSRDASDYMGDARLDPDDQAEDVRLARDLILHLQNEAGLNARYRMDFAYLHYRLDDFVSLMGD